MQKKRLIHTRLLNHPDMQIVNPRPLILVIRVFSYEFRNRRLIAVFVGAGGKPEGVAGWDGGEGEVEA